MRPGEFRISAWWSLSVEIGPHSNSRKLRSRPLRDLERVLGHRMRVNGLPMLNDRAQRNWVYDFDAWNYLEAPTIEAGVVATLNQLRRLTTEVTYSPWRLNRNPPSSHDPDESSIAALYWSPPKQIGLPRYLSSGVWLLLTGPDPLDPLRPVVRLDATQAPIADYEGSFEAAIICSNKRKLLDYHLPLFVERHFPDGVEIVDIEMNSGGRPNRLTLRKHYRALTEEEAICACLTLDTGFNLDFEEASRRSLVLMGTRTASRPTESLVSFSLRRIECCEEPGRSRIEQMPSR